MQKQALTFYVLVILCSANTSLSAESTTDQRDFYWWIQQLEQIRPQGLEIESAKLTPSRFMFEIRAQSTALVSKFMLDIETNGIGIPQITELRRRRIDEQPEDWPIPMMVEYARPAVETTDTLGIVAIKHVLSDSIKENPPPFLCLVGFTPAMTAPGDAYHGLRRFLDEEYENTTVTFDSCELPPPQQMAISFWTASRFIDVVKMNEAIVELQVAAAPGTTGYTSWILKLRNFKGRWDVTHVTWETSIPHEDERARDVCRIVNHGLTDSPGSLQEGRSPMLCFPDQIDLLSIPL